MEETSDDVTLKLKRNDEIKYEDLQICTKYSEFKGLLKIS